MKDIQGIQRGKCTAPGCECEEYRTVSSDGPSSGGKLRCEYCNHTPVEHVKIIELGACSKCKVSGEDCEKYESDDPNSYTDCAYCGCSASYHAGAEKLRKPQPQPTLSPNVGAAVSSSSFVAGAGGFQPRVDVFGLPTQSAHLGTCKLPGCQYPRRFEGNKVHEFCSKTCSQKYAQMTSTSSGTGMGHGTTPMSTVSPAVLQTVMSIMAGGSGGMSGSSAGVSGGGSSGTSSSTVNPPIAVVTTSGPTPSSVTTTVACSQCGVNPATRGHILCQKCFQAS